MNTYVLLYQGGPKFTSREEGMAHMKAWREWMDGMGDAVVNRGAPFGKTATVGPDGVSMEGGASGYTVIQADSLEAAIELVKPSPHVLYGSIEVSETMDMEM